MLFLPTPKAPAPSFPLSCDLPLLNLPLVLCLLQAGGAGGQSIPFPPQKPSSAGGCCDGARRGSCEPLNRRCRQPEPRAGWCWGGWLVSGCWMGLRGLDGTGMLDGAAGVGWDWDAGWGCGGWMELGSWMEPWVWMGPRGLDAASAAGTLCEGCGFTATCVSAGVGNPAFGNAVLHGSQWSCSSLEPS